MNTYWQAIETRDRSLDGAFVYGVTTTKIFCRPSCASRRPLPANVEYFDAPASAQAAGFRPCKRCRPADAQHPEANLMEAACRYIDAHAEKFHLAGLARHMGYSPFHLQRLFKAALGITPRAYAEARRVALLRSELRQDRPVIEAVYNAGYSSSSRAYEQAGAQIGMTPATYRKHGLGTQISFAIAAAPLGLVLVAHTGKGVCSIAFGDSDAELESRLRKEFSSAVITRDASPHLAAVLAHLNGAHRLLRLPLDIQATAFQRRVWEQLQQIPYGETRSYSQVARAMDRPSAARAVARACASNAVALAIPCHRVVREDGSVSGYRWGVERKQALLNKERQ